MQTLLLITHLFIAICLIGIILLQRSEGGALGIGGSAGGLSGMPTVRGAATILTRTTIVLAVLFMSTSLLLAIVSQGDSQSVLDTLEPSQQQTIPTLPGDQEALKDAQQNQNEAVQPPIDTQQNQNETVQPPIDTQQNQNEAVQPPIDTQQTQ